MSDFRDSDHPRGGGGLLREPHLRDDPAAFAALRGATVAATGLDEGDIEKDYYATQVLRSAIQPLPGVNGVIFKGGTSLQKGYGLIERFSEDVDLIVLIDETISASQKKKCLERLAKRAAQEVGGRYDAGTGGTGWQNARVHYDVAAQSLSGFASEGVLLEMGTRGGPDPHETRTVTSFMGATAPDAEEFADLRPFDVIVLAPERTAAEKLAFIHHRGVAEDFEVLQQGARHLYDLQALLNSEPMRTRLQQTSIASLMPDIDQRSERAGWPFTPRPEAGFASSPAFQPGNQAHDALRSGYETLGPVVWGALPSYDEAIDTIHRHAALL